MAPREKNSINAMTSFITEVCLLSAPGTLITNVHETSGEPDSKTESDRERKTSTDQRPFSEMESLIDLLCGYEPFESIETNEEGLKEDLNSDLRDNVTVYIISSTEEGNIFGRHNPDTIRKGHRMGRHRQNNASPLQVCIIVENDNDNNLPFNNHGRHGENKQSRLKRILQGLLLKEEDVVNVTVIGHLTKKNGRWEEYLGHPDKKNGQGEEQFDHHEKKNGRREEHFGHTDKKNDPREEHFGHHVKENGRGEEHFGHRDKEDGHGEEHFGSLVKLLVLGTSESSSDEESDKFIYIRGKGERVEIRSLTDGYGVVAVRRPQVEVVLNSGPSSRLGQISEGPIESKSCQDQKQHTGERWVADPDDCHGGEDDEDHGYFARMAEAYKKNFCEETADLFSGTMEAGRWNEIVSQLNFTKSKADQLLNDSVSVLKQKASEAYDSHPHHTSPPETLFRLQEVLVREAVLALAKQCREQNAVFPQSFEKK
ncbi:uncharacterized protein LOC144884921 isoform X2 [Branchiostoma floridae x Branchiostoma japonicum]